MKRAGSAHRHPRGRKGTTESAQAFPLPEIFVDANMGREATRTEMVGETAIVRDLRLMALAILGGREGVDALVEATLKHALAEGSIYGPPAMLRPWLRALMEVVRDKKVSGSMHPSQTRTEPADLLTEGSTEEIIWAAFRSLPRELRMILIAFTMGRGDSTTAGSIMGIGPDEAERLYARAMDLMGRITEAT